MSVTIRATIAAPALLGDKNNMTEKEAYVRIKELISQDEDFVDVDIKLMRAKHSTWERALYHKSDNQSSN